MIKLLELIFTDREIMQILKWWNLFFKGGITGAAKMFGVSIGWIYFALIMFILLEVVKIKYGEVEK